MNRLAEVRGGSDVQIAVKGSGEMAEHMAKFNPLRALLKSIESKTREIKQTSHAVPLQQTSKLTQLEEKTQELMASTDSDTREAKRLLDEIKQGDQKFNNASPKPKRQVVEMRKNAYNSHARALQGVMSAYSTACKEYRDAMTAAQRAQLEVYEVKLDDEQIAELGPAKTEEILQVALSQSNHAAMQMANDLANASQQRNDAVLALERSAINLLDIQKDLAVLIDVQGEKLDIISTHVDRTKQNVAAAVKILKATEKSRNSARNCKCYLVAFLAVTCLIVVIYLWASGGFSNA
jgi:t-SNARE complex subunit (syntaxin)